MEVLYENVERDVYSAPSASVKAVMPALQLLVCADCLSITSPGFWREDGTVYPSVLDISDQLL